MTYEELKERLYKAALFSVTTNDSKHYENIGYDFTDEVIQLFATLCAEVIGLDGKVTSYTRRNGELSVDLTESYYNTLRKQQRTRLAQLTTKNTNKEK